MTATDIFASLKKSASSAMDGASQDVADELTKKFQTHLTKAGIPKKEVKKARMVFDKKTSGFEPEIPEYIKTHTLGSEEVAPSGVVVRFTNTLSDVVINRMHSQHLMKRSQGEGLV